MHSFIFGLSRDLPSLNRKTFRNNRATARSFFFSLSFFKARCIASLAIDSSSRAKWKRESHGEFCYSKMDTRIKDRLQLPSLVCGANNVRSEKFSRPKIPYRPAKMPLLRNCRLDSVLASTSETKGKRPRAEEDSRRVSQLRDRACCRNTRARAHAVRNRQIYTDDQRERERNAPLATRALRARAHAGAIS